MIKVAIIGCGKIAQVRHLPEYAANPNVELVGYYDLNRERAEKVAAQYGGKALAVGFRQGVRPGPVAHGGAKVQQADGGGHALTSRHAAARKHHGDADGLFKK